MLKKDTVLYNFFVLLLVSAVITITGCKKDSDNPAGNISSVTGSGKVTLNGGGFSNKECNFQVTQGCYFNYYRNTQIVLASSDSIFVNITFPGKATGQYKCDVTMEANGYWLKSDSNGWTKITKYEQVSGRIEGSFEGYLHSQNAYNDSVHVSGSFSVMRLSDSDEI